MKILENVRYDFIALKLLEKLEMSLTLYVCYDYKSRTTEPILMNHMNHIRII